jgi:beta-1,4-mannosyl-glycoprotein beta-1,4-N-acetylglucosaminyltransferase
MENETMTVYDCFIFYNELDLLDLRLQILGDVVDYFVIAEGNQTFSGMPKPLYYAENMRRYESFNDRILHVVRKYPVADVNPWVREEMLRNSLADPLKQRAEDHDVVLISDIDEMARPQVIQHYKDTGNEHVYLLQFEFFYYYLNNRKAEDWPGSVMGRWRDLKSLTPQQWRERRGTIPYVQKSGWHFSYLGDPKQIARKIATFAHQEYNTPYWTDPKRIDACLRENKDLFQRPNPREQLTPIPLDDTFPLPVVRDPEKYRRMGWLKQT